MWTRVFTIAIVLLLNACATTQAATCHQKMMLAASRHSIDMAKRKSLDHKGFIDRVNRFGAGAENVAIASSKEEAMRLWLNSPSHAANIAMSGCRAIANYGRYWTMEISQ